MHVITMKWIRTNVTKDFNSLRVVLTDFFRVITQFTFNYWIHEDANQAAGLVQMIHESPISFCVKILADLVIDDKDLFESTRISWILNFVVISKINDVRIESILMTGVASKLAA